MKRKFIHLVVLALLVVSGVATAIPASAVTYGDPVETPQIEFPEVVPVWIRVTLMVCRCLSTADRSLTQEATSYVTFQLRPIPYRVGRA